MNLPQHIAIIMDGNGRWAKERGLPRMMGHREGVKTSKEIVKACANLKIPFLSLYVFSTENGSRSSEEVQSLMNLLKKHLGNDLGFYTENNIRVLHIGDLAGLPLDVQEKIAEVQEKTKMNTGMSVVLAINYGGHDEIVRAVNGILKDGKKEIVEADFASALDTHGIPYVDFLIRTGKEMRISNFLLWQIAYAELYFSNKYWPDWKVEDLEIALEEYEKRNRRFGREK